MLARRHAFKQALCLARRIRTIKAALQQLSSLHAAAIGMLMSMLAGATTSEWLEDEWWPDVRVPLAATDLLPT